MKARGLAVLAAAAFFSIVTLLNAPWPVSAFVCLPLYVLGLAGLVIRHNVSARPTWKPDASASGRPDFPELRVASELAEAAGLRRIGDFRRPTLPENGMRVFRHPDGSSVFCIRRTENDLSFECVTFLNDGGDLTTTTDVRTRYEPRPFRRRLLISRTADPLTLIDEHLEGVRLLAQSGKQATAVDDAGWLAAWTARESDLVRHIRSSGPLWPFRVLGWKIGRPERGYGIPLRNRGLSSGPGPVQDNRTPGFVSGSGVPSRNRKTSAADIQTESETGEARLFRVVFRGAVAGGFEAGRVKTALMSAFRLDDRKADALFSGRPVSVKSGVDRETALRYQEAFLKAGALAELEPLEGPDPKSRSAGKTESQAAPVPLPADGRAQAGSPQETLDIRRFRIESLLASERLAFDREKKAILTVGWPGYVLAIASFIPYVGPIVSSAAVFYGWARRRSGGGRIIALASMGGLISVLASIGSFEPKLPGVESPAESAVLETRTRLNGLVRAAEDYRERTGDYPESLFALAAASDTLLQVFDPMAVGGELGVASPLTYSLDASGVFYHLLSSGRDRLQGTADDITPDLPAEELSRTGWRPLK